MHVHTVATSLAIGRLDSENGALFDLSAYYFCCLLDPF
jgi:hypothetical protein